MISADDPASPTGSGWVDDLLIAASGSDARAFGLFYDHVEARSTQPQREVLLRSQRQGQTHVDIGKVMNLPVSAVSALARDAVTLPHEVLVGT